MNMNHSIRNLALAGLLLPGIASAQERYGSRTGHVAFYSSTSVENIEANNHKAASVYDATTGAVEFSVLIKAFEFEKALMQEHFNENYMESNTYPKAIFKGKVTGVTAADLKKPGRYDVMVDGELEMHGVKRKVSHKGAIVVQPTGMVHAECDFTVRAEDYKIDIPALVRKQIAEDIQVKVRIDYQKM